jgi:hypothetical protein
MPAVTRRCNGVLAIRSTETWTLSSAIVGVCLLLFVLIVLVALIRRYMR